MNKVVMLVVMVVVSLFSLHVNAGCKMAFLVNGEMIEYGLPHSFCSHKHE